VFGAMERAFPFNFTCLGARNANGTNTGTPERRSRAFRPTLTTASKCLGERSFSSKVIVRTCRYIHIKASALSEVAGNNV